MLYTGEFTSRDKKLYRVDIQNGTTEEYPITFTSDPVTIKVSSASLFAPIKSRGVNIKILSKVALPELYNPTSRDTSIIIKDISNGIANAKVIFKGYLTPCVYDQDWSYVDVIELEGVDAVSTCKDYKFNGVRDNYTFYDLITSILSNAGYSGYLYSPKSFTEINGSNRFSDILKELAINGANFYDDDEEHTPWTEYEVLEEIMKFLGWSVVPDGEDVWLVDYRYINSGNNEYIKYNLSNPSVDGETYFVPEQFLDLDVSDIRASGNSSVSIEDIYNKIDVSDNLYKIDEISPKIFEDENLLSVTQESGMGLSNQLWVITTTKYFLWWETDRSQEITGYDYQTFYRLKESTGWKHHFYKFSSLPSNNPVEITADEDGKNYFDPTSQSKFTRGAVNRVINTAGCLLQRYAHRKNDGKETLPATLDWNKYLTFFTVNDTIGTGVNGNNNASFNINDATKFELPVLEYETSESVNWKPSSGCSWITFEGDIYYQYNGFGSGENGKTKLNIINFDQLYYTTAPVDSAVTIDERAYLTISRSSSESGYGTGIRLWKMKVQIGTKFWNGDNWVEYNDPSDPDNKNAPTFYIKFNNDPEDGETEFASAFSWMSMCNNKNFKDKVGVDGYCIPIDSSDENAPKSGKLHLTIYTPSIISPDYYEYYIKLFPTFYMAIPWSGVAPVIFVKDFEMGYVYTDSNVWYNNGDISNDDKVYTGWIDPENVKDFDGISLKINTSIQDRPISRSYVVLPNNEELNTGFYLKTLKHVAGDVDKEQEYNIVDLYLDHHSDKKFIYNTNVHSMQCPVSNFNYSLINGNFVIDSQSFNLDENNNKIKLIAF